MKNVMAAVVAVVVVVVAVPAGADVVMPPPEDCPEGSVGEMCHGPYWCVPRSCSDDADCDEGMTCRLLELCIQQVNCSGRAMIMVDHVAASCAGGAACTEGECRPMRVCAPGEPPEDGGPDGDADGDVDGDADADRDGGPHEVARWGCDCNVVSRSPGSQGLLGGLLVVVGLLLYSRRGGPRP